MKTILFCGWGRAGKDEAATFLSKITTLRYAGSTSWAGLPHMAKFLGVHPQQAWEERHQNRELWKTELDRLREIDQCLLARLVLETGDISAGIRDKKEIDAIKAERLFDRIVWISRVGILMDPTVTFSSIDCDEVIHNNGTLADFHRTLVDWAGANGLPVRWAAPPIKNEWKPFVPVLAKPFEVGNE